jgi:hypothetical protein
MMKGLSTLCEVIQVKSNEENMKGNNNLVNNKI